MSMENFTLSDRAKRSNTAFYEALEADAKARSEVQPQTVETYTEDHKIFIENHLAGKRLADRYNSFTESVRNILLTEALCKMFNESVSKDIVADKGNASVMRSIVIEYVNENGFYKITDTMKTASVAMSELSQIITKHAKSIIEAADKDNPDTFVIKPEMKDSFFNALDYSNTEEITTAIHDRVSTAMQDFVTANTKDHEDITTTLQQAQEKIAEVPEEDVELKEHYEMRAKQEVAKIRRAPKSILHHMVTSMCESVVKHPDSHAEFMNEDHLNMDKIVTRTTLLYTFVEMLNTARIEKIDEAFLESLIMDLKK